MVQPGLVWSIQFLYRVLSTFCTGQTPNTFPFGLSRRVILISGRWTLDAPAHASTHRVMFWFLNIKNIAKDNSHLHFINVLASLPFLVLNFWQPWPPPPPFPPPVFLFFWKDGLVMKWRSRLRVAGLLVYESVDAGEISLPGNFYIFPWWTFILYFVRVGFLFFPFSPLMREELIHENPTSPWTSWSLTDNVLTATAKTLLAVTFWFIKTTFWFSWQHSLLFFAGCSGDTDLIIDATRGRKRKKKKNWLAKLK